MNINAWREALHCLVQGREHGESLVPEDVGTDGLFLDDKEELRIMGATRVLVRRGYCSVSELVLILMPVRGSGVPKDPNIVESDNLCDVRHIVLRRPATEDECRAYNPDLAPRQSNLTVFELLRISYVWGRRVTLSRDDSAKPAQFVSDHS